MAKPLNLTPWLVGSFLTCTFLEGYVTVMGDDKKTTEGMNEY